MIELSRQRFSDSEFDTPFLFQQRHLSLPEDLRPSWRIALLVLLMNGCCRGRKSSRARLHVLSWSVRSTESLQNLLAAAAGELNPRALVVRVDPFLDRAIDFAIGEGLIERLGGKGLQLTSTGKNYASAIVEAADIFVLEKSFIQTIGHKVTEDLVAKMFGWKE